jgi:N-acyl-D-amino-acid deacylase
LNPITAQKFDILLYNGLLLDGSGTEPQRLDVGILGEYIAAVGDLSSNERNLGIDCTGLHIAPGFVDIHTHSDISITYDAGQGSALGMGVTTQVVGNCGLSMGLVQNTDVFDMERRWLAPHGARIRWNSLQEHLHSIESTGIATNYLTLIGHGSLRKRVMGLEMRSPTNDELLGMQREIRQAMEAGAWGISTGLEYPPSAFANVEELIALCKIVGAYGGFYATHLRNEGDTLIEAVQEALAVAEGAGVPLQLSHHKAEGEANWGKVRTTLQRIDEARERGLDVQQDQYPYPAFMTALAVQTLPGWANAGSIADVAKRLSDPTLRARVREEVENRPQNWDRIQIGICRQNPSLEGHTIAELAERAGKHPLDYVLDLLSQAEDFIAAINFAIGEEDIAYVLKHPYTSIGSDGVGTHPQTATRHEKIHPRTYGTFPRVLSHYVRELGVLSEATAIHKMTTLPATRLGLKKRGAIREGYYADITIYSPETISDAATFETPHQYAVGVHTVLVNGRVAWQNGQPTQERAGQVLRHTL